MDLYKNYLSFEPLDVFKTSLLSVHDLKKAQEAYFACPLSFGTAGLRGVMQPGLSGINGFMVAHTSLALARYLKKISPHKPLSICISYDNRHHSREFADIAARLFAHEGIAVKLAAHLRPTPWLSFAVRQLRADAGVMITASHNPKIYNGYKVYLADGGQIVPPHDKQIMELIAFQDPFFLSLPHDSHIELIEESIDQKYLHMLKTKFPLERSCNLKIIYSPLCGTGAYLIPQALKEMGFTQLEYVKEEMVIDPEFAAIATPNPETDVAMQRSCKLLVQTGYDIALVSDPDADRVGLACLDHHTLRRFSGHEIAILLLDYLIQTTAHLESKIVASSFVTTPLLKAMCHKHGLTHQETLTGFKYIGQIIDELESSNSQERFLLGAEESYGYLIGTHAKDKDAIISSVVLAKAAQKAKHAGYTLFERLLQLYQEYGLYVEDTYTLELPLDTSQEKLKKILAPLLAHPPEMFFSEKVEKVINYQTGVITDFLTHTTHRSHLPSSEALGLFSSHSWLIVRPSGTEPKIKIYAGLKEEPQGDLSAQKQALSNRLKQLLKEFAHRVLHG